MLTGIALGLSAGSSILSGIVGKKNSKYIAKAQRDIANIQYEYNKKEVERAFKTNLENLMKDYAGAKLNASKEAETILSNINIQLGKNNVDEESFDKDIKNKVSNEIADNMTALLQNQLADLEELSLQKTGLNYQVDLNYSNAISSINQALIKSNYMNNQKILSGITSLGLLGVDNYLKNKNALSTTTNTTSFTPYDSDYFSKQFGSFSYGGGF